MPPLNNFQKSCIALAVGQALIPNNLQAATITVDDPTAVNPCTLYDAFEAANTNTTPVGYCVAVGAFDVTNGGDTIVLPADTDFELDSSINADETGLIVDSIVTLQGNSSVIRRDSSVSEKRLIDVLPNANLTINDLGLFDGNIDDYGPVLGGAAVRVEQATLTINDSALVNNETGGFGGAVSGESATITLNNVSAKYNQALFGGAVSSKYGSLTINDSNFSLNGAFAWGGAVSAHGDDAGEVVSINRSSFLFNQAAYLGGAVRTYGADLDVQDSNFTFNFGGEFGGSGDKYLLGGEGGAIQSSVGDVSVTDSNFKYNLGGEQGSAIAIGDDANLDVDRSSFSRNQVAARSELFDGSEAPQITPYLYGGAISISKYVDYAGSHTITNSTFSSNYAPHGGALSIASGETEITNTTIVGGEFNGAGFIKYSEPNITGNALVAYGGDTTVTMQNSVISQTLLKNSDYVFFDPQKSLCETYSGADLLTVNKYNFFQDDSCNAPGNGDPKLARRTKYVAATGGEVIAGTDLGWLGGGSKYSEKYVAPPIHNIYIPLFDSPLQNAGAISICTSSPVSGVDQRNLSHAEAACDIGAIDSRNTIVTVDSLADDLADGVVACSLRDALVSAQGGEGFNAGEPRSGSTCAVSYDQTTIAFDPLVFPSNSQSIIALNDKYDQPYITTPVNIVGPGKTALTIDGAATDESIFNVYSGNLSLSNLTLTGGGEEENLSGGGVNASDSVLTLDNAVISNNTASSGGGIVIRNNSCAYINQSTVSDNYVTNSDSAEGGGIFVDNTSYLYMTGSTVSGNSAVSSSVGGEKAYGGGIAVDDASAAIIINSTVSGNSVDGQGGGIHIEDSSVFSLFSTIADNSASESGGGVFVYSNDEDYGGGEFIADHSIVSGNFAYSLGNEVALDYDEGPDARARFNHTIVGSDASTYVEALLQLDISNTSISLQNGHFLATSTDDGGALNPDSTALEDIIEGLANNGGPTQTHALPLGSPAIDGGEFQGDGRCESFMAGPITRDQRGRLRSDGLCDLGSFEYDNTTYYIIRAANGNVITIAL